MPAMNPTPRIVSGVEALNNTLADVLRRINNVAGRVGDLANQFGAPHTDSANAPTSKIAETTNDWTGEIGTALSNLERITSRIDNQ